MARKAKATRGPKTKAPLSLRAFAKRAGVSHTAVRKGVESGRLRLSVGRRRGQPIIMDAALGLREWAEGATKPNPGAAAGAKGPTLTDAQFRLTTERATGLRLSNDQRRGRLIDAETARRDAFDCARIVRDAVLNVPVRIAGELPAAIATRVLARLDEELRKALESASEELAPRDQ